MNNVQKYDCGYFHISRVNLTSTEGAYLYKEEASWAAMGTSLAKRSGPVTVGSVGLTGSAFTRGAPRKTKNCSCNSTDEYKRRACNQMHSKEETTVILLFSIACTQFYSYTPNVGQLDSTNINLSL